MKKKVFLNKIKTALFIGFLIIFGFFLFNQKASAFIPPATFEKNIDFFIDGNNDGVFLLFKPEYNPEIIYSHGTWTYSDYSNSKIASTTYIHLYEVSVNLNGGTTDPTSVSTDFLQKIQGYPTGYYWLGYKSVSTWATAWTEKNSTFWPIYWDGSILSYSQPYTGLPYCGSDAGKLIETTPVNLCDAGTAGTVSFDGSKWNWDCISGVVSQSCRAYLATTEPVDGTCGAWNGETFNTWPPLAELCELRTSLVVPSMVETINGYTWACSGINGGTSDYCSGNKTSPPLMPELPAGSLDDCSGLSILEGIVCNMGNTLKTIFLPSSEKINELNQTINKMASKFPFSYISKATETFNNVKGNITETSMLELSIMGSEKSSIDFSTIAFFDYIKMLTTILIIIVFSFWLIRFIKHIF